MKLVIVAGSSGQHAAVVHEAAMLSGIPIAGFVTIEATVEGALRPRVLDCPDLGGPDELAALVASGEVAFVAACGSNALRRVIGETIMARGALLQSVVHPAAILSPSATIGAGSMLLAGAIVGPSAQIGQSCIVNHATSVDHDCIVGDYANICPGARIGGAVHIEEEVFVGLNAAILPRLCIGAGATVGAGAVVTADVEANTTVAGIPARPLRKGMDG